eukprot:8161299-Ditylum_brightwellii.AAC.1
MANKRNTAKSASIREDDDDDSILNEDLDLTTLFPMKKIKAQLQRDEGVGRISTKAIEFIGACSAIFVHDLAKEAAKVGKQQRDSEKSTSSPIQKEKETKKTRGRKRKLEDAADEDNSSKNTIRVKLDDVRQCIENNKEKFDFLVGITENLSESKASGYAAAMTRKLKRKSIIDSSKKAKVTANSGKKRKGEKKCNVLEEATGSIDE